jgi:hypothetical protein
VHKRDEDVRVHVEHRAWARPAGGRRSLSSLLRLLQAGKVDVERLPLRPLLDLRTRLYISTLLLAAGRDSRSLLLRQALCDGRDARSLLVLRRGLAALALHFVFVMLWHCGRTCSVRTRCERCVDGLFWLTLALFSLASFCKRRGATSGRLTQQQGRPHQLRCSPPAAPPPLPPPPPPPPPAAQQEGTKDARRRARVKGSEPAAHLRREPAALGP